MKLLIELSMECESLARAETIAAAEALGGKPKVLAQELGVLVIDTSADPSSLANRLGLCHFVSEWKFSCRHEELGEYAEELDVPGPIRVRSTKVGKMNVDLAGATRLVVGIVGKSTGVDLRNPQSDVRVVFSKSVHAGKVLDRVDRASFEKRKNRYMPYCYPASLHPKFARALVNLTRVKYGGRLLDPFCGTGAIVAEASLSGLEAIGSDVSEKMIEGAKRNLKHIGANATLNVSDVGNICRTVGRVDGIATDPPYGKSTSTGGEAIHELFKRSFEAFADVLNRDAYLALVVPHISLLDDARQFEHVETHSLWVHRSLTRNFCLLRRS